MLIFMKKPIRTFINRIAIVLMLMLGSNSTFASHLVGVDLSYTLISGDTYKITFIAYGNCGAASHACFITLPTAVPSICIYDGATYVTSINLAIDSPSAGIEITPVCPAYADSTQCHNSGSSIPGIVKFVYTGTYTFPHNSTVWRLFFEGDMGASCATGRAAAITNITAGTTIQVVDTLNSYMANNSSTVLTVDPVPFFCENNFDCYNPGAVDPDGDSTVFSLVAGGSGTGACGTIGGSVAYIAPYTAELPLQTLPGSFSFNTSNGQICFNPNAIQRSLVVYNIEKWRHDTLCGTSQREMTFTVQTCTSTAPGGGLDSLPTIHGFLASPVLFKICQNDSNYVLNIDPRESDTANLIYITYASLPPGTTATLTNNGTNHPNFQLTGSANGVAPGSYTFSLNIIDNNCPIAANEYLDYTVMILPQPQVSVTVIDTPTCLTNEVILVTPGGSGNPWRVFVSDSTDTMQRYTGVISAFYDTITPPIGAIAYDTITIMTADSTLCDVWVPLVIKPVPPFVPTDTFVSPPYCGSDSGYILLTSLPIGTLDTVRYHEAGFPTTTIVQTVDSAGQIYVGGLYAGAYDSIVVSYGNCVSTVLGPDNLVNPVFQIGVITYQNPTLCGYCDGTITIHGLHPGQTDTLYYIYNTVRQPPVIVNVTADSNIYLTNMCPGLYEEFYAKTDGICESDSIGPIILDTPSLLPQFAYTVSYGCTGDTVRFTNFTIDTVINFSTDSGMFYLWNFGDGTTDTTKSPTHIFNRLGGTFHVVLYVNNLKCQDSVSQNVALLAGLQASFSVTPNPACQTRPVNMDNTTTGTGLSYYWDFGDGNTSILGNPTHVYPITGGYEVTFIATDFVPCSDTLYQTVYIDSISGITMTVSDSSICLGGAVTFASYYSNIGNTGVTWTFSDGSVITNENPIQHSFDGIGTVSVTAQAFYRACPDTTVTSQVRIYSYPSVYLGVDTSICPGGDAIYINDYINGGNPGALWSWNTGATTPGINVTQPGTYIVTVTIDGCATMDTIQVYKDCYMNIPNVFSPNGDGVNDYFYPRQELAKGLVSFSMVIYNRWGQIVFQTTALDGRGWDGTFNGTQQPEDVYIYIIDAAFKDGEVEHQKGNITLIR